MKIKKIKKIEKPDIVYNLHVKNNNNYFANGICVSNCHTSKSNSIRSILKKCVNAEYRIGLTGTLPDNIVDLYNIFGYIGPRLISVKSEELIEKGYLSDVMIANLFIQYPKEIIQENKKRILAKKRGENIAYKAEYDLIIKYENRNKIFDYIIKNINTNDNVLILCERKEHLSNISEYTKGLCEKYGREQFIIHGDISADKREEIRQYTEKNDGVIILATYGTMSTGVNIKKLHHIVAASSYKAKIKVLQSIGRGLRLHKTKKKMIWWDIIDDLRWEKRKHKNQKDKFGYNYMFKQFLTRLLFYKDQNFKYVNKKVDLTQI